MTPEQLDALFPARRAECEALCVNPDRLFIPRLEGQRWTAEQCRAVFPHFGEVWHEYLLEAGLTGTPALPAGANGLSESESAQPN